MITPERDQELMQMAVDLAHRSRAEDDDRAHPKVGAVIAHPHSGEIISTGFRGQYTAGFHAEQEALIDVPDDVVRGAVVYSTLEPCTLRGKQMPCCQRLLDKGISEVVIGILDPNRDIRGRGWWKFEEQHIKVRNFHPVFVREIREMNEEFIDEQLGPGIMITEVQQGSGSPIEVTIEHRRQGEPIEVSAESREQRLIVRGTYRTRPQRGHRIRIFVKRGFIYWPQQEIDFDYEPDRRYWEAPAVWVKSSPEGEGNEILVADLSEDLLVATGHYSDVHATIGHLVKGNMGWVGLRMNPAPPGLSRLGSSITIKARLVS
jgi:pyrimidine deaminase RibD-like protein